MSFRQRMSWTLPWYSSAGSDFNYDFHVTLDASVAAPVYNYAEARDYTGEGHGLSVFVRDGERVFHTYSTYARGCEAIVGTYTLLDLTPFGSQEQWEAVQFGRSRAGPMGWLDYHDRYQG
jgi:predicted dithiol-disulfide oxidoreductase (DUF899 family)